MLTRLYLNNCFTHQDRTIHFDRGLTGVIGPNESGKSLIVEMIRFALFGSKALRGKADDYKKLHVELDFEVRGQAYEVVRKGSKVTLKGDNQEVSGTKPVDEAIRSLLGYDLLVFDVANACNQGNIEALSTMTPSARKQMVDKTVGLTVLDDLIKYAGAEGNALKREADAMQRTLVEPVEPVAPENLRPSTKIKPELEAATADLRERDQLKGFLQRVPEKPKKPAKCKVKDSIETIKAAMESRRAEQRKIEVARAHLRTLSAEVYSAAQLDEHEAQHDAADRWEQKKRLLARGYHECPECNHQWPVADLGDLEGVEEASAPQLSRADIRSHRQRLGDDAKIAEMNARIADAEKALEALPDRSEDLETVQRHEADTRAYNQALNAFNHYNEGLAGKQARFEELEGIDQVVVTLQDELRQTEQFERDLDRYQQGIALYEENLAEVEDLTKRAEDFLKAREVIQALKVSVKTHLLPSLNKVASVLLSQMTGGERYQVEVDEDFEILIDGQPINTLSGSGKAVANLAIRIALGQILTNRVFSVFMADEVDAAMDDERAAYTADALRRLTDTVGQVILVTHKRPETDHMVELKKG